jgi:putative aldouronate transport system substrate-binding protein
MAKKLASLMLVLAMVLCLVPAMAENAGSDYSAWFPGVDTSEHVVVTYLVTGNIPTNKTDEVLATFNEKLTAAINAEIAIEWIEWADWQTKYNLALAMQDGTVDLVGTATDWLDAWPNSQKGAFLTLSEDMLKTYCPKTYESVSQAHWDLCKYGGDIYMIPEDNYAQWTNHGFLYRGDWAKEAGLENGVHSWEELGQYFQYIKDTYPDVIPWDADGFGTSYADQMLGGWIASKTGGINIEGFSVPLFFGNSKDDLYTLSTFYTEGDSLVEFAKLMKQWNDAGYWREDVLNYSGDVTAELHEGLTGAHQHHTQTWKGERYKMNDKQPGSDLGFFWFGEESSTLVSLNITHGAMAVAAQSDNPERALMAYDLIRNDQTFYRLFNYGIEGEQYIIDENGYMARPDTYTDDSVDGVSFNYWWGRNDNLELRSALVDWPAYDALMEQYGAVKIDYPYGQIVFDRDPISAELDNLSNVFRTYAPVLIFGKEDDPEAYVDEFRQALKDAGIDQAMAEVQSQLDAVYGK